MPSPPRSSEAPVSNARPAGAQQVDVADGAGTVIEDVASIIRTGFDHWLPLIPTRRSGRYWAGGHCGASVSGPGFAAGRGISISRIPLRQKELWSPSAARSSSPGYNFLHGTEGDQAGCGHYRLAAVGFRELDPDISSANPEPHLVGFPLRRRNGLVQPQACLRRGTLISNSWFTSGRRSSP